MMRDATALLCLDCEYPACAGLLGLDLNTVNTN